MAFKQLITGFSLFLLSHTALHAQETANTPLPDAEPYVVQGSRIHKVTSEIVANQIYELRVSLPGQYYRDPETALPVIYVLDGQWNFTITSDIVGKLSYDGMIPDPIVVAITWGGENDNPDQLRQRDFTASENPYMPNSGGAQQFLSALKTEIIPFVENHYNTSPKRVLTGASLGGLFTSYALLEDPDLFDGYVAMAAPYQLEQALFTEKLAQLEGTTLLGEKRLLLAVGSLGGNLPYVKSFAETIQNSDIGGLSSKLEVVEGVSHAGVEPIGYTLGFQYAFQRPQLDLSKKFLSRYNGVYESEMGLPPLTVSSEKGVITLNQGGEENFSFLAESKTRFYINGIDIDITFVPKPGNSMEMLLNLQGTQISLLRQGCDTHQ